MPQPKPEHDLGRRGVVRGASGLALAALAAPYVARAAAREIRFGHNNTDDSPFGKGAAAFVEAAASDPLLANALTIRVYGNAQLGDDLTMLKGCINGTIDGALVGASAGSNIARDLGVLNAPYIFRDVVHARTVLDGPIGAEFMEISRAQGMPVLAWGENGLRHITANKPIRDPAGLRGLKIRVPQSDVMMDGFRAFGAVPAPLAISLLAEALRVGQFEAQENPITIIEAKRIYELQKFLCLTGHIYDPLGFVISPDLLEDLTEPQRAALAACARKGAAVSRAVSDTAAQQGIARLKAAGMVVIEDVDLAAFRDAARPYLQTLPAKYGEARVKGLLATAA